MYTMYLITLLMTLCTISVILWRKGIRFRDAPSFFCHLMGYIRVWFLLMLGLLLIGTFAVSRVPKPELDGTQPMKLVTSHDVKLATKQDASRFMFKLKDGTTVITTKTLTTPKFVNQNIVLGRGTLIEYHLDNWNPFKLRRTTYVTWVRLAYDKDA